MAGPSKRGVIQGICPRGWHLPSDREWNELEKVLTSVATTVSSVAAVDVATWQTAWETQDGFRGTTGLIAKSLTKVANGASETLGKSNTYDNANMSQRGFDVSLVGTLAGMSASLYGRYGYFWSSSAADYKRPNEAMHRYVVGDESGISAIEKGGMMRVPLDRTSLISIRCKKNEANDKPIDIP